MKDWKDYATNINGLRTQKPNKLPKKAPTTSPRHESKPQKIEENYNLISLTIENTALLFILPGMWLFYVYLLLTGESPTNGGGVTIVGTVASAFLGLMLVFNAIMALISYIENRKTELSHHYQ